MPKSLEEKKLDAIERLLVDMAWAILENMQDCQNARDLKESIRVFHYAKIAMNN